MLLEMKQHKTRGAKIEKRAPGRESKGKTKMQCNKHPWKKATNTIEVGFSLCIDCACAALYDGCILTRVSDGVRVVKKDNGRILELPANVDQE